MGKLMKRWGGGWAFFGLFLALAMGTLAIFGAYYRATSERRIQNGRQELVAVANITAGFLARWRSDRIADAQAMLADPDTNRRLANVIKGSATESEKSEVHAWLGNASRLYEFKSATLTDSEGNPVVGVGEEGGKTGEPAKRRVLAAIASGQPILSDLHFNKTVDFIHLDLVVPIKTPGPEFPGGEGAVLFRIDPERSLYRELEIWPGAGLSAERFIARKEGGSVTYLSPLKFKEGAPLKLSQPCNSSSLLFPETAGGETESLQGLDYRGELVIGAARTVPGTEWIVVAQKDMSEVMAPVRHLGMALGAGVMLLILATGGVGWSQWRSHRLQNRLEEAGALDNERKRFQGLAECAPFGFAIIEPDGGISYINPAFTALFGYRAEDVPTQEAWREKAYPDASYRRIIGDSWRTDSNSTPKGGLRSRVFEVTCKNGAQKTVRFYSALLPTNQVLMTLNDITEQAASRAKLQASEERFRRFFEDTPAACYVASAEGELLACNAAYRELLGFASDKEAFLAPAGSVFCSSTEREALIQEMKRSGRLALMERSYQKGGGGEITVLESVSPIPDEAGEVNSVAGFMVDVTKHKELEKQLRLAQRMESIGQLSGGVAHDFNNLLQAILGSTEILQRGLGPQSQWQHELETIQRTSGRAAALTKQLLAFSRQTLITPQVCDPNPLVEDLLPIVKRLLPESIQLDFIPGQGAGLVFVDKIQFEQVILNLCVNARDAMPLGGAITVETTQVVVNGAYVETHPWAKKGRYVLLTVTDSGVGMTPDVMARAFEPFFTTKGPGKGTGLGLSTVYGIVKQHGGMVNLYSEPGKGTAVKLYLPVAEQRAAEIGARVAGPVRGGSEKLLVVEDDREVLHVVTDVLRSLGYEVISASDGREALDIIRESPSVQLVLSDVVMPRMGGRELMEQARVLRPGLRFLLTSGYSENAVHHGFVLDPRINFISKPYGMDSLARKVRETLDARPAD